MKYSKYSAVVIGSGIAGLYSALKLEQQLNLPDGILLITKSELGESNSYYAQGGMVAVLKSNKNDSVSSHVADTIKAGAGLSELNTIKFISENSDKVVKDLLTFGVEFDRDENGNFTLTKEAAHSVNRILHSGGDATGREMEIALCHTLQNHKNIKVYENSLAVDLLVENNTCDGVVIFHEKNSEYETVYCKTLILATGGLGQLYKYTTNPVGATGDGFALAYNVGAELQDMEFVQFHPTALAFDDKKNHNRFLISEAVRGEGAKLCNKDRVQFMYKYDERKELAPRDIVARSIFQEMKATNTTNVYLDTSDIPRDKLIKRFPTIANKCLDNGIDITKDLIPVAPAAHYFMGGVKTNLKGETSIKGLYAIGEVSSTGLHGGNRLASNSLLECVVCAYEVAEFLRNSDLSFDIPKNEKFDKIISKYEIPNVENKIDVQNLKSKLKDLMWNNVGIYRNEKSLNDAINGLNELEKEFPKQDKYLSKEEYEFKNMLISARLIVKSAIRRKESRGAHYRTDYLETNEVCEHSILSRRKGELSFAK
ncbi:TPA: L-aspartate oxidase [Candidatus Gastranaerophilales bacterium HUM_6]|nr:l-aspartate oxidase [Fusobacterium sp. CAG:815]DAA90407.1 MAG TPA: L-aspartate oxidase [Candidatus Gastranaerophilales bacterium HUM_6]DAA94808.1 MAG TPA: L-aspartate oxidase [Candidatus Gastranaerophilales bacterium HUM_7]DAB09366.1 MAG TPA: L-aspartate oxidase [Candidatus Gastranaerophilales bacterium HUM_14]